MSYEEIENDEVSSVDPPADLSELDSLLGGIGNELAQRLDQRARGKRLALVWAPLGVAITTGAVMCATPFEPEPIAPSEVELALPAVIEDECTETPTDQPGLPPVGAPWPQPIIRPQPPAAAGTVEARRILNEGYPDRLREAGVRATTEVWLFASEEGRVDGVALCRPSGYRELDDTALQAARALVLTPARLLPDSTPVGVWVRVPFTFQPD